MIHSVGLDSPELDKPVVACILDEFSRANFSNQLELLDLGPHNWSSVLDVKPDFLLVESAWRGMNGAWRNQIASKSGPSPVFRQVIVEAQKKGIPTVFWNKEDPPNFDYFIGAARMFDRIFTTAVEAIPRYRKLGLSKRVDVLPFFAEPALFQTVPWESRRRNPAFAGSYHKLKHMTRKRQMASILLPAREFGLQIYARDNTGWQYAWPRRYRDFLVGSLDFPSMIVAYSNHKVFLNINSVNDSTTMVSRRLFEIALAGTPVISYPSPAISNFFGESVLQSADKFTTRRLVGTLLNDRNCWERYADLAKKTVLQNHTARHRVNQILESLRTS